MTRTSMRSLLPLLVALLVVDALIAGTCAWLGHEVVPGWKKGPLIDPAAPYAPENACVLFAWVACAVLDLYVIGLLVLKRWIARSAWPPVVVLLLAILVAEVGLRTYIRTTAVTYFRPHPVFHWQVRPHLHHFPNNQAPGFISTNADGMRDVTVGRDKPAGELRVLVLGDSSNFGHGVDGSETLSARLEANLQPHASPGTRVVVLNGACPGWTTYQGVEFLRRVGLRYHPDVVLAGFNNDAGPDYLGDRARLPSPVVAAVESVLFRVETFLVAREVFLSTLRRFVPAPDIHYSARVAGESPKYDRLPPEEASILVPRVSLAEFLDNLQALDRISRDAGARFAWVNMPVNRLEPDLVARYVDWEYRTRAEETARTAGFLHIDADGRWQRTREYGLHQASHVHHPNALGQERLAEQAAAALIEAGYIPDAQGDVAIGGPPLATTAETLRFGISTFTPVHAHVAAVLRARPELAAEHGLTLELTGYASGKGQGVDVSSGALDAFFTCEVPAVQMLGDRTDLRIVGSPGVLGRIAVVAPRARARRLQDLAGARIGLVRGSTPHMDWGEWGTGLGAVEVDLTTEGLEEALVEGKVDAVAAWDPWVEDWLVRHPDWGVVAERPFRSDLAVGLIWAVSSADRTQRLMDLVAHALGVAASDRPRWDAEVARMSGWPVRVVAAVADRNDLLSGRTQPGPDRWRALAFTAEDRVLLGRALRFTRLGLTLDDLVGARLLEGQIPPRRSTEASVDPRGRGQPVR